MTLDEPDAAAAFAGERRAQEARRPWLRLSSALVVLGVVLALGVVRFHWPLPYGRALALTSVAAAVLARGVGRVRARRARVS